MDPMRDGACHFAGGGEMQGLVQPFHGPLALVDHDPQVEAGQRKRGHQRLQLDDRQSRRRLLVERNHDAELYDRDGDQGPRQAGA
jgi:hypothetical protein